MTDLNPYRTMDPAMLYSLLNTRLRNDYRDLDDLARALGLDRGELENHLAAHGCHYDEALMQFR